MAPATIIDALLHSARTRGDTRAVVYNPDGAEAPDEWSFAELARRSAGVAAELADRVRPGERAILAFPQGLEFLASFFGAMIAGVVPVPMAVPRRKQAGAVLSAVARDSGARVVLSAGAAVNRLRDLALDDVALFDAGAWAAGRLDPDGVAGATQVPSSRLAFLQYTSGSTGLPRGVCITHANIVANQCQIAEAYGHESSSVIGSWLPMFHDMGLAAVLQSVWLGLPCILMSPAAFVRRPSRWLDMISRYGVTTSGGPDFGYVRCIETAEDVGPACDLSRWNVAFNGAEPVRPSTIERFGKVFSRFGFRPESFYPVYGLAESTAFVSGPNPGRGPAVSIFDRRSLAKGKAEPTLEQDGIRLVGCGWTRDGTDLKIVDPDNLAPVSPGSVGEILIRGDSVSPGYWAGDSKPNDTGAADGARGPEDYLRTGDLGFDFGGEIYLAGRRKDLIIWHGANIHPQQIEDVAGHAHAAFDPLGAVAFAVPDGEGEAAVAAVELRRQAGIAAEAAAIARAVRLAVLKEMELPLRDVVVLPPNSIERTTSGKPRRAACRARYLAGAWTAHQNHAQDDQVDRARQDALAEGFCRWLQTYAPRNIDSFTMDDRRTIPPHVVLDLGRSGILGMMVGQDWGGPGLGHSAGLRVLTQLGAIDLTLCLFVGLNNYLGIRPIQAFATGPLRDTLLPDLASGRRLAAFALSEPGAGSNPRAIRTSAREMADGLWRIDGTKIWSGAAAWAGTVNVFARQLDQNGVVRGHVAFAADADTPGLLQGPEALTMGMRGLIQNTVVLTDARVPDSRRLGAPGEGMSVAQDAMMHARLAIAAGCVGAMRRCVQIGLAYAGTRRVATGILGELPTVRAKLADIAAEAEALDCLVKRAAGLADRGRTVPEALLVACKALGPELLWAATDSVMQLVGGRGYIETGPMAQMFRDARVLRIFEGPTETMRAYLGSRLGQDAVGLAAAVSEALDDTGVAADLMSLARRVDRCTAVMETAGWDGPDARNWMLQHGGEAVALAILAAAGRQGGRREVAAVTARRLQEALDALDPASTPPVPPRDLLALRAEIGGDLGWLPVRFDPMLDEAADPRPALSAAIVSGAAGGSQEIDEVADWLCAWLQEKTGRAVPRRASFADTGLDSLGQLEMVEALSSWCGRRLDDTAPWDFPTVAALAAHVAAGWAPLGGGPADEGEPDLLAALDSTIARLSRDGRDLS